MTFALSVTWRREFLCDVGLSGARRAVEDQLTAVPQQLHAVLQPVDSHVESLGEFVGGVRQVHLAGLRLLWPALGQRDECLQVLAQVEYLALRAEARCDVAG